MPIPGLPAERCWPACAAEHLRSARERTPANWIPQRESKGPLVPHGTLVADNVKSQKLSQRVFKGAVSSVTEFLGDGRGCLKTGAQARALGDATWSQFSFSIR